MRRGKPGRRVPTLRSGRGQPHLLFGYWRPGPLACRPPPALAPAPAPPFPQTPRQMKRVLGALAFWERTQEPRPNWFFLPGASPTLVFVISMESLESRSQPPQHIQTQKDLNWEGISRRVSLLAGIWCTRILRPAICVPWTREHLCSLPLSGQSKGVGMRSFCQASLSPSPNDGSSGTILVLLSSEIQRMCKRKVFVLAGTFLKSPLPYPLVPS